VKDTHSQSDRRRFLKSIAAGSTVTIASLSGCLSGGGGSSSGGGNNSGSGNNSSGENTGTAGSASSLQNLPDGRIQMIVPWAAGGGTDRTARKLASQAKQKSDSSFYVSNITGGTGSAGFRRAANAQPDGTTIGVLTVEICTISHIGISDITPDAFAPIIQYNFDPAALTVRKDAPYDTVQEFVNTVKNSGGEPTQISNSGIGGIWHLSAAKFAQQAGISEGIKHIGYDGGAPARKAVVSGEVDATTASAAEVAPQVKDGPLKTLGIMGENRVGILPNVKTFQEQNFDVKIGAWRGLGAPAETPNQRVQALANLFTSIYESKEFENFMKNNGFGMVYRSPSQFNEFMSSEYDRFGNLIDNLNISQ
jgi:tripartite-type tricarboxylate transporter receptor subunit TctC